MKFPLDTHTHLWHPQSLDRMPRNLVAELDRSDNDLFLSVASLWEATIKISKGRLTVSQGSVRSLVDALAEVRTLLLPITPAHESLPKLHKDPFDRIVATQSLAENTPLVTMDRTLQKYGIATVWDD